MAILPLKLKLTGDKEAKQGLKGVNNSVTSLGKSAMKLGVAYFGARGILSGFQQSIALAGEQELAEKKLAQALGSSTKGLLAQASALQQTSRFGDEAIIQQQAFLASIGLTEEQIKDIIPVTLDLASATGMSLESAVKNTAKTLSGMTGELGESVGALKDLTAEQLKAGEGIEVMREMFKGMAETEVDTLTGSIDQMMNALGDTAEAIGKVIAPTVIVLAKAFKGVAEAISFVISASQQLKPLNEAQKKIQDEMNLPLREQLQLRRDELTALIGAKSEHKSFTEAIKGRSLAERQLAIDIMQQINTLKERITEQERELLQDEVKEAGLKRLTLQVYPKLAQVIDKKNDIEIKGNETLKHGFSDTLSGLRSTIKGYLSQAIASMIAREFATKGLFATITASAGAIAISNLFDSLVPSFAKGGSMVVSGKQLMMVGDNATGMERVTVDPIGTPSSNTSGNNVVVNINAPLVDETVRDSILPSIQNALNLNLA